MAQLTHLFGAEDISFIRKRERIISEVSLSSREVEAISKSIGKAYRAVAQYLPQWIGMQPSPGKSPDQRAAEEAIRTMEQELQVTVGERYGQFIRLADQLEPCS